MTSPSPIDFGSLAALIDTDDPARLREIADLFARSSIRMLARLQEDWARGDTKAVKVTAHGWKGAAKQACAAPLAEALARIEADLPEAAEAIAEVERRFQALQNWIDN